jgi:hypothetical protein
MRLIHCYTSQIGFHKKSPGAAIVASVINDSGLIVQQVWPHECISQNLRITRLADSAQPALSGLLKIKKERSLKT